MLDLKLWPLLIAIAAVAIVVMALRQGIFRGTGRIGLPYQRGKALFSAAERSFLGALDQALGPEYRVFGKVRVADVATVKSGLGRSARQAALNRIGAKHLDFVVRHANDLAIVCAIELNDSTHSGKRVRARDQLLADVCRVIDLPLLTIRARASYSIPELRAAFESAVNPVRVVPAPAPPQPPKPTP